jgi:hypothetical protein
LSEGGVVQPLIFHSRAPPGVDHGTIKISGRNRPMNWLGTRLSIDEHKPAFVLPHRGRRACTPLPYSSRGVEGEIKTARTENRSRRFGF